MRKVIRPGAHDDILRQYRFLLVEEDRPLVAQRFLQAVQLSVKQICRRPGIGAPLRTSDPRLAGMRSWPVVDFPAIRIYYHLSASVLVIVRVLHGKRDILTLLENEEIS